MIVEQMRLYVCRLLVLALTSAPLAASELAPEFTVPTRFNQISLHQLKGKVVYLDFWASWCIPCFVSFPWMHKMQQKYSADGLVVVAINLDKDRKLANEFLQKQKVNFIIGFDRQGKVPEAYKLKGMPSAFIIDKAGTIRFTHIGFSQKKSTVYERQLASLLAETKLAENEIQH